MKLEFKELVVWLPGVRYKWLLGAIVLGEYPLPGRAKYRYLILLV